MKVENYRQNINLIALLTDFGTKDYFIGAMKGAILSINSEARIIDITHEIEPQDVSSASFTLCACYRNFPKKTIFVAVVDPGVGSNRRAVLVETENYFFIAPDNGLLSFVFNAQTSVLPENSEINFRVYEITNSIFIAKNVSVTFHGRDIFAPVAAHLSNGVKPEEFGSEIKDFVCLPIAKPQRINDADIEAAIIHIDRFGNLITNLKREDLPGKFSLVINGRKIEKLRSYYAEAGSGEIFMIFGSAGFLEIVAFRNSAAKLLGIENSRKITVKIL